MANTSLKNVPVEWLVRKRVRSREESTTDEMTTMMHSNSNEQE